MNVPNSFCFYESKNFLGIINEQKVCIFSFTPLPDDKILVWSKLKQIADDILVISTFPTMYS